METDIDTSGRVIKLYLNIGHQDGGHYKSFRVSPVETFGSLTVRALDKVGVPRSDVPFFSIIVKFHEPFLASSRIGLRPHADEVVCDVLEREALYHDGDLRLLLSDRRCETFQSNYSGDMTHSLHHQESKPNPVLQADLCTEFIQPPVQIQSVYQESVPETLLREVRSISLMHGRLQYQSVKESWREMAVELTEDSLWMTRMSDTTNICSCIPLTPSTTVCFLDESSHSFVVISKGTHAFRAKSRIEMQLWMDALRSRSVLCGENDVIFMADEYCARGEAEHTKRDVKILTESASFEGTLRNSYMRGHFRQFLRSNFAEESMLCWEYAEDFRRGHPLSPQPLVSRSGEAGGVSMSDEDQEAVKKWSEFLCSKFIADGAPMQVAIPGDMKVQIENDIKGVPGPDVFTDMQSQLFNHLKFQIYPNFVQASGYRALLMSTLLHISHECEVSGQAWLNTPAGTPSLLLHSPDTFHPSFFKPRTYTHSGAPYSSLPLPEGESLSSRTGLRTGMLPSTNGDDADTQPSSTPDRWSRAKSLMGFLRINSTSQPTTADSKSREPEDTVADLSDESSGSRYIRSGRVPTPWRSTSGSSGDIPQWLPQYWWTHVDFSNDIYHAYDGNYDDNLMKMLPKWMKALLVSTAKRSVILNSLTSKHSVVLPEKSDLSAPSDKETRKNNALGRVAATDPLVHREVSNVVPGPDEPRTEDIDSVQVEDSFEALLPPTHLSSVTHFSSCGRKKRDGVAEWEMIPVPHLARRKALDFQLPNHNIAGRIIRCGMMLCQYVGILSTNAPSGSSPSLQRGKTIAVNTSTASAASNVAINSERDTVVIVDSQTPTPSGLSSAGTNRLAVYSHMEGSSGELRLYDTVTGYLTAIISLGNVTKVIPSVSLLHTIELHDGSGSIWYLRPQNVFEHESTSGAKLWLELLASHCSSVVSTILICHEGYLSKRGQFNKAFKRRWFVLDSEQKLRYYARLENGQSKLKGEVDVTSITDVMVQSKEIQLTTSERVWQFLADSDEDASFWEVVLRSLVMKQRDIAVDDDSILIL
mmetsp:Transcript_22342/g.32548  ORF Transcript_22342/g.32548 Transcript_22342/m.32548 type:complete len:1042 (+) Transcript_22342:150-3275(+)|eukprot:CAMPEP_0185022586 /NCGR_PEP_ID=MMETSP1103-20130426/5285_1 /TAXON_ID=36769 /ORGANISM="Paraphysomonas bandaiensis, Strain Caron Lab Isolate" /LENGTH=1041 /DNA_ID=CAMNT_0027554711 /DNA_START=88 /DNA_END=3213 /DNA_ORIENTATION=-